MANAGGEYQYIAGAERMLAIGRGEYDIATEDVNRHRTCRRVLGKQSAGREPHERESKRAFLDERPRRASVLLQQCGIERELVATEPMKENGPARLTIE